MWWTMVLGAAWAGYYLEAPPSASRVEAAAVVRTARAEGWRAKIVRRYQHGDGWVYVSVVESFDEQGEAEAAAAFLAEQGGVGITVFSEEGPGPLPELAVPSSATGGETVEEIEATELLAKAQEAHGSTSGGLARLQRAPAVVFRYRREVPDGPAVRHVYAAAGDRVVLATEVENGEGVDSLAWFDGEDAWLVRGESEPVRQDVERTLETLARFSPARVLAFALGFAEAVEERREFALLYMDGPATLAEERCWRLRYDGDQVSGPLEVLIASSDHRLRQVAYAGDAGQVVHQLTDWTDLGGGLVVPGRVRTWRADEQVDQIEILELATPAQLPESWFQGEAP